ncbi:GTPase HflX [Aggregatilinea lenta]|uniref:GTPase HflX n=1 Tax=Aggregatilinea lenta TaxID=913108 RepID=UPI001EE7DB8D|nr:GTPase HflX [Aggregatilinea lenta]
MPAYFETDDGRSISGAGRALLVGVEIREEQSLFSVEDSLDELALLAQTAGVEVVGRVIQRLSRPDPATFIGSGKVGEVVTLLGETGAAMVIFDDELSPRHQRELEKAFGEDVQVLDRSALILDIFAQHAQTREGALQVELAQYEYRLPRLTRQWTHLARQAGGGAARGGAGGVGLRGPGETQLEVDRREIRRKILKLKEELEQVRAHRQRHRNQRSRAGMPTVALVGYTNAGKSTLLNALSGADVYVADQLFATLDPTTRRVKLPSGRVVLLTDTVGFIQKLPVTLAAAFRATLEEVAEADVILHVVDASHPRALDHIDVVEDTLAEIDATRVPEVLVLNKRDRVTANLDLDVSALGYRDAVSVSALKKTGLQELLAAIGVVLSESMVEIEQFVSYRDGDLISSLYDHGVVLGEEHIEGGIKIKARVPVWLASRLGQLD